MGVRTKLRALVWLLQIVGGPFWGRRIAGLKGPRYNRPWSARQFRCSATLSGSRPVQNRRIPMTRSFGRQMNARVAVMAMALVLVPCLNLRAQDRMPPIPAEKMTDAQKK